jgi:hypothetical protein
MSKKQAGQVSQIIDITPEQAIEWLSRTAPNQRTLKHGRIKMYASDMIDGNWKLTHQGIAFNTKGELIDGQNRLSAICRADMPVKMVVTYNVDNDAMPNIDLGIKRSGSDVYRITGESISNEMIAIARMIEEGETIYSDTKVLSPFQVKAQFEKHREAIAGVCSMIKGRHAGLTSAPVLGAFCRAWYHVPQSKLQEAMDVLMSGIIDNTKGSHTLIRLRDYLINTRLGNSGPFRMEKFRRVQRCIKAYVDNENLSKLITPGESCYKLPTP